MKKATLKFSSVSLWSYHQHCHSPTMHKQANRALIKLSSPVLVTINDSNHGSHIQMKWIAMKIIVTMLYSAITITITDVHFINQKINPSCGYKLGDKRGKNKVIYDISMCVCVYVYKCVGVYSYFCVFRSDWIHRRTRPDSRVITVVFTVRTEHPLVVCDFLERWRTSRWHQLLKLQPTSISQSCWGVVTVMRTGACDHGGGLEMDWCL